MVNGKLKSILINIGKLIAIFNTRKQKTDKILLKITVVIRGGGYLDADGIINNYR